ncbi:3-oxoacyl-ACP reductase [Planctomycetales bacterium]|nr:3-oxoacyl-ACP reductase [Planctomycetales bacterium]
MTNILITGATGGIGSAVARSFAQSGTTFFLHTFQNVVAAQKLADELRQRGAETEILISDFTRENAAENLHQNVFDRTDCLDVLVNAAGLDLMSKSIRHLSFDEKLQYLWKTDVAAPTQLARLSASKTRTIFFFGWNGVEYGWAGDSAQLYGIAKGAVKGFCKSFAATVAPDVRVCCLSLGWIKTRWGISLPSAREQRYADDSRLNRWGTPEEVAAAVRFLADEKSQLIDATNLFLDGGKK